jgi:hypothetical protein
METAQLIIERGQRIDDKTGKTIVTMRPVLLTSILATGRLEFAQWEAWDDDSTEDKAWCERRALENARTVLKEFALL